MKLPAAFEKRYEGYIVVHFALIEKSYSVEKNTFLWQKNDFFFAAKIIIFCDKKKFFCGNTEKSIAFPDPIMYIGATTIQNLFNNMRLPISLTLN